jgi:hypothetical protein
LVAAPALFTSWGLGFDFVNHLWLVRQQATAIHDSGLPTLYLQSVGDRGMGLFVPFYGFYGGSLYAVVGALAVVLGDRPNLAYGLSYVAATAMAYGGMWWLAQQAGVRRLWRHVPAIVFVTGAYYLTDAYARGAWPEFVALSALPLAVAGAIRLLTADWNARSVLGFALGCVALTGTHNISLMWSGLLIVLIGTCAWIVAGRARPKLTRIAAVAAVAAVSAAVNGWFLLFDLAYGRKTIIDSTYTFDWDLTSFFNTPAQLLTPIRTTPVESGTPGLVVAAPVAALAVALVLFAASRPQEPLERALRRLWWLLGASFVAVLSLMMSERAWEILGRPFTLIQFPYRLAGWLAFLVALLLVVALRLSRSSRLPRWAITACLAALMLVTAVQAERQLFGGVNRLRLDANGDNRLLAFGDPLSAPPKTWYAYADYHDSSRPVVTVPDGRAIALPAPPPGASRFSVDVDLPSGPGPIATNIGGGPYAVRATGVDIVGRTPDGSAVIAPPDANGGTTRITLIADAGPIEAIGTALTLAALLALGGLAAALAWRGRRRQQGVHDPE